MTHRVSAVLLAAGSSRRMGRPKQLLPVNGRPAVRACAETLLAAGITDVVAVTGQHGPAIAAAFDGLAVRIVPNPDPLGDMASSVRAGLAAVEQGLPVLICLADHPLVAAGTVAQVLAEGERFPGNIIIPSFRGRRGHPTLFPRAIISDLAMGTTLRDVITSCAGSVRTIDVGDEGVILDLDTPEDYARIQGRTS